jgi:hypothetical protein
LNSKKLEGFWKIDGRVEEVEEERDPLLRKEME